MAVNKIYQAALHINGDGFINMVDEADVPLPTATVTAHQTMSSLGDINLFTGFEPLEGRIKWNGPDETVAGYTSDVLNLYLLQFYYQIERYTGNPQRTTSSGLYVLKVRFRGAPNANFTPKANVDSETQFDAVYVRHVIDGVEQLEYDPANYIYKVRGVDMLADLKRNLGI